MLSGIVLTRLDSTELFQIFPGHSYFWMVCRSFYIVSFVLYMKSLLIVVFLVNALGCTVRSVICA